jgi:hypothetical protein
VSLIAVTIKNSNYFSRSINNREETIPILGVNFSDGIRSVFCPKFSLGDECLLNWYASFEADELLPISVESFHVLLVEVVSDVLLDEERLIVEKHLPWRKLILWNLDVINPRCCQHVVLGNLIDLFMPHFPQFFALYIIHFLNLCLKQRRLVAFELLKNFKFFKLSILRVIGLNIKICILLKRLGKRVVILKLVLGVQLCIIPIINEKLFA